MRWQYRLTWAGGNSTINVRDERLYDCLNHFRDRFSADRIVQVEERYGDGGWVASELLPVNQEEADALERGQGGPVDCPELSEEQLQEIEDWLDGIE